MPFNMKQMPLFGEANQVRPLFNEANQMWSRSKEIKHKNTNNEIVPKKEQTVSSPFVDSYTKSYCETRFEMWSKEMKHKNYTDNKIVPEKEQSISSSFLPLYTKSYSQTRFEVTMSDYTWKIDQFGRLAAIVDTLSSPPFGGVLNNRYKIQMNISRQFLLCVIRISIRTNTEFSGSCTTTIMHPPETVLASRSISDRISDMALLIDVSDDSYISTEAFVIHCKIEHFHLLINNTIHMNLQLQPPPTVRDKEIKLSENPTFDFQSENEKSIKFIVGEEEYVI